MSDTPDQSDEPRDAAPTGDHPEVPDLMLSDETEAADDAEAVPVASDRPSSSKDSQRLMIAIAILVVVAVAAIGVGIARKSSTESASTTNTSAPTTTAAAGGAASGKPTTTKAGTPTTVKAQGGCRNGAWPTSFTAPPDAAVLKQPGIHVWNQNPGWRIRVVDPEGLVYSGEVVTSHSLDPKSFTSAGTAKVEAAGNKATFEVTGGADAAGIDFQMPCAVEQFTIALTTKGAIVSPDRITIGKDAKAVGNPVVVTKVATS